MWEEWEEEEENNYLLFGNLGEEQREVVLLIILLQNKLLKTFDGIECFYRLEFIKRILLINPAFPINESILEELEKAESIFNK